ncbi:MAG: 2-C-methyl-D-erythritol 4-phosphate cytidylyltransferase [Gammaproteobacteria bacterium]|nr:MAG: 2-C-methyl-D-erythritol 4-phosphate cytidylyltransferase [Gammaproteobacteria bacterium]
MIQPKIPRTMDINVIIPAAGKGRRFGSRKAKQYLEIAGRPVLCHTLTCFSGLDTVRKIVLVTAQDDQDWQELITGTDRLVTDRLVQVEGGQERCDSVLNGLEYLYQSGTDEQGWVMVHDAARPCVTREEINRLIEAVKHHDVGGILGLPVVDTLKEVDGGCIRGTANRDRFWRALTPQMFRFGILYKAMKNALAAGIAITDEAMAVESLGYCPLIVRGSEHNLKITYPDDCLIAEHYLHERND